MRPERSSSQSSGYWAARSICSLGDSRLRAISDPSGELAETDVDRADVLGVRLSRTRSRRMLPDGSPLGRRLQGIEPLLGAVDVLAGPRKPVLLDLRAPARADHLADAEGLAERETAVADVELVAVERADGRPGGAVALGVVLAPVAGTAESARRQRRDQRHLAALRLRLRLLVVEHRPVRLHRATEVRAPVREHGEARLAADEAVVPDVGGTARDLALLRVTHEGRDDVLAFGDPEEGEQPRGRCAHCNRRPADDQADEDADDPDREADRPQARWRKVRSLFARPGLHLERLPFSAHLAGFNRLRAPPVNDVTADAMADPRKVPRTFRGRSTPFASLARE